MNQTETFRYKWEGSSIRWKTVEKTVFKLQKRIYRAAQQGNTPLVRKLQRLLLHSTHAKLLAIRKVTQDNRGKRTAGVDGKKALSNRARQQLLANLKLDTSTMPIRRVWIDKVGTSEKRPLGIPTIRDRVKQAWVKMALEPEWEARFEPNSYGFRPGRCCQDAIEAIFCAIHGKQAYVLDADIAGCFNTINHRALLDKLQTNPKLRRIIKAWLKAGIMEEGIIKANEQGTPQGGIISPLLANIALHGMENDTKQALGRDLLYYAQQKWGLASLRQASKMISIVRYADDFVVIHESKEVVQKAHEYIATWLKSMGLVLKAEKTSVCHTYRSEEHRPPGFTFLGFHIRQYRAPSSKQGYKTIIKPDPKAVKRHRHKLKGLVRRLRGESQETLIRVLNPVIVGWSRYYRYGVARKVFEQLDHQLFWKLWRWACWRHDTKGKQWVREKYFHVQQGNQWCFKTNEGKKLALHTECKITRFVKVGGMKSPYDGDFVYWSTRQGRYPTGSYRKATLLKRQQGRCSYCDLFFQADDLLEVHHVNQHPKDNQWSNLTLVHGHCHDQMHRASGMSVKHQNTEEPDEVKVSRPVLKPSMGGDTHA